MAKLKEIFRTKDAITAYEGLVIVWPCVDAISCQLLNHLDTDKRGEYATVLQAAVEAYHQQYPFYMTDWERLAVYIIIAMNYVAHTLEGRVTFRELVQSCKLHRRLSVAFIEDTARKLSMELEYA